MEEQVKRGSNTNKWIVAALIIIGVLVIIGVLYDKGTFDNMQWSSGAMIFAALAGPYVAIKNFLFGNKHYKDFEVKYNDMRTQTIKHRVELDERISSREKRIAELDKEMELIEAKMDVIELKKKNVEKDVNNMGVDEIKNEVHDLFGD